MTDRELLELAAKAAGIEYTTWHQKPAQVISYGNHLRETRFWNPLKSDGDALRLAVKLGISVSYDRLDQGVDQRRVFAVWGRGVELEHLGNDPFAATRRTIVSAAAEIGKSMK